MSFTVSSLTDYTEQHKSELLTKAVFGATSITYMNSMVDIKSAATINLLDTDATFQSNSLCGWNASGTTTLTQRTITVGNIKVQEALCPKTLEAKYTQKMVQKGSTPESFDFEREYTDLKSKLIAKQLETAIWQGDITSGTGNLNKFDGLLKLIGKTFSSTGVVNVNAIDGTGTIAVTNGSATVTGTSTTFTSIGIAAGDKVSILDVIYTVSSVDSATQITLTANYAGTNGSGLAYTFIPQYSTGTTANPYFASPITSTTGITSSNIIGIMQAIYAQIPVAILDDPSVKIFVGNEVYRNYITALINANLFAYAPSGTDARNDMIMLHGTNIPIVSVNGLNNTNRIICTPSSNLWYGTDMMNEEEKYDMWYSKDNDEVRFHVAFKAGVNYAFADQIVQFTLA
jgi:hypothetical protein